MKSLITILCLLLNLTLFGQTECSASKIIGEWKYIRSFYKVPNIDSLKKTVINSNESTWIWNFNADRTYTVKATNTNYHSKGHYKFIENPCEIIFGKRRKPTRLSTSKILFLSDEYLLIIHPTPKQDRIDFLSRH